MSSQDRATSLIPFRNISEPELWTVGDKPTYIVVTEKNWSIYYPTLPTCSNFTDFLYVVVSPGMKPNPGYTVKIQQLKRVQDRITVKIQLKEPDPGKVYPQIIVQPIAVAEIAKVDLKPWGLLDFVFIDQSGRELDHIGIPF